MRLFVAVDLPDAAKQRLARLVAALRSCRADVRWVSAGALHVTLKFLGNVDAREVGGVDRALERVSGAAPPTRGRLRDLGSFPHKSRPRVLWVGLRDLPPGGRALADLHRAVDAACNEIGFPSARRRFHPHVTLGRVRSQKGVGALRRAIDEHDGFDAGEVPIRAITLFESRLARGGARYTKLGAYRLRGAS